MTKETIRQRLLARPFVPHPALRNPHAQTLLASLLPRRTPLLGGNSEARVFEVGDGVRLLAHCSWQPDRRRRPTLLIVHGLQGSARSGYMLGTAEKALRAGFNAVRLNLRNCGGSEHLTDNIYHAGLTDDVRRVAEELIGRDGLPEIYLVGFSLGGNQVLKLAGEYAGAAPAQLRGVVAVSPSLHLASCADAIEMRSNVIYHLSFLLSLKRNIRRKAANHPERYDLSPLARVRSIRQFDDAYVAPHFGFRDAADYYGRASALPLLRHVALPALIVHAKDDPFIPFAPFEHDNIRRNPHIALVATDHGGHVGFLAARAPDADLFWYETAIAEFVRLHSDLKFEI